MAPFPEFVVLADWINDKPIGAIAFSVTFSEAMWLNNSKLS